MSAFNYIALDKNGKEKKGVLEGSSARNIREQLRDKALSPLEITPVNRRSTDKSNQAPRTTRRKHVHVKDLSIFTRQLATLLAAGMPLEESLRTVGDQTEKPHVKGVILGVRTRVLEGHSLATGMEDFPNAFPHVYRATVAAGEHSGRLDMVLERLADFTEKRHYMRQKIKQALIYPTVMTLVSISIVAFLLTYVVPRMVSVFEQSDQTLPFLTIALLAISHALKTYGIFVLAFIVAGVMGSRKLLLAQPAIRFRLHQFLLRAPFIGNTLRTINTARFARTLGILTAATVPILEGMRVAGEVMTLLPMKEALTEATARVSEGTSIHKALQETRFFSPMTLHLISSGEASGQLESMLEHAANNQERDVEMLLENVLALFEPALIIVMGLIVLFIVLAILLPIFSLEQMTG